MRHEVVTKFLFAGDCVKDLVANVKAVVFGIHWRPLELAAGQKIKHAPGAGSGTDITDVMHANIPLIPLALIGMSVTARRVMLLQHANLPAEFAQKRRGGEATHTRADYNGVIFWRKPFWAVTIADAQRAGSLFLHRFEGLLRIGT